MKNKTDPQGVIQERLNLQIPDLVERELNRRRLIFLDFEIDEAGFLQFSRELLYLHLCEPGGQKPIWIILNSPGGDILYGFGIYDLIRSVIEKETTINILCTGMVASMSAVILQAGSKRVSFPNTQFLIHQVSQTIFDKNEEVNEGEERVEENKRVNRITMGIIAERIGMDLDMLLKLSKKKGLLV